MVIKLPDPGISVSKFHDGFILQYASQKLVDILSDRSKGFVSKDCKHMQLTVDAANYSWIEPVFERFFSPEDNYHLSTGAFIIAATEMIENNAKHNYDLKSGPILVHARKTPCYNLVQTCCESGSLDFDRVLESFRNSHDYATKLKACKEGRLPASAIIPLMKGKGGRGFKDAFMAGDYYELQTDRGNIYHSIISLNDVVN